MIEISVKDGENIVLSQSKSLVIRQLIAYYLYRHKILDIRADASRDVMIVQHCLQTIEGASRMERTVVDVQDCGAAYRFLAAVLSIMPGEWLLTGAPRLLQRPIDPLLTALQAAGADIHRVENGLQITGKNLQVDSLEIDCTLSSQFASALLLVAPLMQLQELKITPATPPSAAYIAMTRQIVEDVLNEKPIANEADWSSAAFWYLFLAASENHTSFLLKDLKLNSLQGDCVVTRWFEKLGIESVQTAEGVVIKKINVEKITTLELDFSQNIDLAPVMAVAAVLLSLDLTMTGVKNLNLKESARLTNLKELLSNYISVNQVDEDKITWYGARGMRKTNAPVFCDVFDDHRLVMAYSLLSLVNDVNIFDLQCVTKSYPGLLNYLKTRES